MKLHPKAQPNATPQRTRASEGKQAVTTGTSERAKRMRRDWRPAFLRALAECHGSMAPACKAARVDRVTVWRERQRNADFATRYEDARQLGAQCLEEEAARRAVDGSKKLVLWNGRPVLDHQGQPIFEVQYSDRLLELLLKRHLPEVYREKLAAVNVRATATAAGSAVVSDADLLAHQSARAAMLAELGGNESATEMRSKYG